MRTAQIQLPRYHPSQQTVVDRAKRFNVLACGRRFGKTTLFTRRACETAIAGRKYGYFAATYKLLSEVYEEMEYRLAPIITSKNKTAGRIELVTGGVAEFWTLLDKNAGRSRKYNEVGLDEAGLVKDLEQIWNAAIRPTLTDFQGSAWFAGTPKGRNYFYNAFLMGQDPNNAEWLSHSMPTVMNTTIPNLMAEIEAAKRQLPERLFRQEYLAEFLDDAGGVFRGVSDLVVKGRTQCQPRGRVYIGIDLAKYQDFTVMTAVDESGSQVAHERFTGIPWSVQIQRIAAFVARFKDAVVYVDSTGVGDPIFEQLSRIPGAYWHGYNLTNQTKEDLINALVIQIEQASLALLDLPEQTAELQAYQYEITPSRNVRMNAPAGMHDDCVIALALACWGLRDPSGVRFEDEMSLYT